MELYIFHDERFINKWLYHAFILTESATVPYLQNQLLEAKIKADCDNSKRIHFTDLSSKSKTSSRTRTAVKWTKFFINEFYQNCYFYLFGINCRNLDYEFFGPASDGGARDFRIYNSFFQIGLFQLVDISSKKKSR